MTEIENNRFVQGVLKGRIDTTFTYVMNVDLTAGRDILFVWMKRILTFCQKNILMLNLGREI